MHVLVVMSLKWYMCVFVKQIEAEYSFLDYVMGGCQINFTVRSALPLLFLAFA